MTEPRPKSQYWAVPGMTPELERLLELLSDAQIKEIADALGAITAAGGFGSVRITVRCGKPKQIETAITKEM